MEAVGEKRVIVGIDIAKEDMFAAFESEGAVALTDRWKHPEQTLAFAELLTVLGARGPRSCPGAERDLRGCPARSAGASAARSFDLLHSHSWAKGSEHSAGNPGCAAELTMGSKPIATWC